MEEEEEGPVLSSSAPSLLSTRLGGGAPSARQVKVIGWPSSTCSLGLSSRAAPPGGSEEVTEVKGQAHSGPPGWRWLMSELTVDQQLEAGASGQQFCSVLV